MTGGLLALRQDGSAVEVAPTPEDVTGLVAALLQRRDELASDVVRIDDELDRIFAQLAADRRRGLPPARVVRLSDVVAAAALVVPPARSCAGEVLAQVLRGLHTTSDVAEALPRWSRLSVAAALKTLVAQGWLQRLGASNATRYQMTPGGFEAMRQA